MKTAALSLMVVSVLTLTVLTAASTGKPEEVGMSTGRLHRIDQMIERRMTAGDLAGAVTIVVRKGKVVHQSARG